MQKYNTKLEEVNWTFDSAKIMLVLLFVRIHAIPDDNDETASRATCVSCDAFLYCWNVTDLDLIRNFRSRWAFDVCHRFHNES